MCAALQTPGAMGHVYSPVFLTFDNIACSLMMYSYGLLQSDVGHVTVHGVCVKLSIVHVGRDLALLNVGSIEVL